MNFWVIVCALALNIATGWLFKPYTVWITRLYAKTAKHFSLKKYKTGVVCGGILSVAGIAVIWFVVDHVVMLLQYQSEIYLYITYGLVIYFCTGCGQTAGIIRKFAGNTGNTLFVRQLFGYMLVKDSDKAENVKFKRIFSGAVSKLIVEKIVMPFLLIMIFGAGATAAYAFISHFANADNHEEMTVHGYAAVATTINKYASLPGYAILSMLLWAIKWVLNMKFSVKKLKFAERCGKQLYSFENGGSLTDSFVKKTAVAVYACTVIMLLLLVSVYIFVQAALAALGLDEYWDFWSGKNIKKE